MKKFTICAVLAAAAMLSGAKASASVFEANDNSLSIRPVLSLDITCPGDTKIDDLLKLDAFKSGAGLSFGAVVDVPVWMNMYLESGLKFYYHTAKYNKDFFDTVLASPSSWATTSTSTPYAFTCSPVPSSTSASAGRNTSTTPSATTRSASRSRFTTTSAAAT